MGNETVKQRRADSCQLYKQIVENEEQDNLILDSEGNENQESSLQAQQKMEINKQKLNLHPQFKHLPYKIKYFNENNKLQKGNNSLNRYEGTFLNDQLFGQGIYFYPSGSIYMGGIKNNGRDSHGIFYFSNGNIYEGQWKDNDQNGIGKFYFAQDGKLFQFFVGNFVNSLYQGFGGYSYQNKYYIGYWANDKYEGHGKIYSNDGKLIVCGIYSNDKLIKELDESEIVFPANFKDYIPNYQNEYQKYKEILQRKPIS